jgi:hypothetical protein
MAGAQGQTTTVGTLESLWGPEVWTPATSRGGKLQKRGNFSVMPLHPENHQQRNNAKYP